MTPIILDFRAMDEDRRRRDWRLAFIALIISAVVVAALVGPLMAKDSTRILNALCDVQTVV
jgi:hypothetical protein